MAGHSRHVPKVFGRHNPKIQTSQSGVEPPHSKHYYFFSGAVSGMEKSWPPPAPVPPRNSRGGRGPVGSSVPSPPSSSTPPYRFLRLSPILRSLGSTRNTLTSMSSPTLTTSSGLSTF